MAHCSHGRAHALQQGQVHARPAAGGAPEGVPAPGAQAGRGRPWSSRLRREAGECGVEGDGQHEDEQCGVHHFDGRKETASSACALTNEAALPTVGGGRSGASPGAG